MGNMQVIVLIIVILLSLLVILTAYFIITSIINKKKEKKADAVFDVSKLSEETPLLYVMEEKPKTRPSVSNTMTSSQEIETFDLNSQNENFTLKAPLSREEPPQEKKINPFNVDLTKRVKENQSPEIIEPNNQNKFIK